MKLVFQTTFLLATTVIAATQDPNAGKNSVSHGKKLFDTECAACHHVTETDHWPASPFPFIRQKYGRQWVYQIIKNNVRLQYYNKTARRLFLNKAPMPIYERNLTNRDIDDICDYIDQANSKK